MARPRSNPNSEYSIKCSSWSMYGKRFGMRLPWIEESEKISPMYARTGSQYRRKRARPRGPGPICSELGAVKPGDAPDVRPAPLGVVDAVQSVVIHPI